jgi:hypothetical protein
MLSLPCCYSNYPNNYYSNKRWCCGDMDHLDISKWAFEKVRPWLHTNQMCNELCLFLNLCGRIGTALRGNGICSDVWTGGVCIMQV